MKPRIVVSAVNISELGPLSVLKDVLKCISTQYAPQYDIVALVHHKTLFDIPGINFIEFPHAKASWLRRIWLEYVHFKKVSREIKPYLWLSMHDITPNVEAKIRAVYCHSPSPFLRIDFSTLIRSPKFSIHTWLYKYVYRVNIRKNDWIVVQQDWLRTAFRKTYGVDRIIVAHPHGSAPPVPSIISTRSEGRKKYYFFYPSYPRIFKNMDVILRAAEILEKQEVPPFEIWLTLDGSENYYAAGLVRRFATLKSVRFLGRLSREDVFARYAEADCLIFSSLLETWGMPISEFKIFDKPMLLADLPYAHETVGEHDKVAFFPGTDEIQLAAGMRSAMTDGTFFGSVCAAPIDAPYCSSWNELFALLLNPGPQ